MDKNKLKELLIEHKDRFISRKGLIKREIQESTEKYLKQREIVLITGVRRSGKSSLMRLICDDVFKKLNVPFSNILYLNFEDERFISFTSEDFGPLYESFLEIENPKGRKYFFLDEIQNVQGWERWVNRLYEFENIKIFITGSNATMLSSEISTALTGRNRQVVTWPFSFREFLSLKGYDVVEKDLYKTEKRAEIKRFFKKYVELGGFPEILKLNDKTLLEQYFKDILYRDLIARYSIRNIKEIKQLTLFLASNLGTIQSYKNLKNLIGVKSLNTVKNYLEALNNVFLFFYIDLFDYSIKRQIYNPSKIYSIDSALSNSISFKFSQNLGHFYENLVFIQLKRKNEEIYYWKSKEGREVDFFLKKGTNIDEAIQVSLSLADLKVKEREIQALKDAQKQINPRKFIILTSDEDDLLRINGLEIKVMPIWKWFLFES